MAVSARDGRLTVEVSDDGVGGAALDGGSGSRGSRTGWGPERLAGRGEPAGRGTRVTAIIPLTAGEPTEASAPQPRTARAADARGGGAPRRNRYNLGIRVGALGIVAGVLVVIWALTGPDLPWIVWPLLGIGLIAGLDAWRVYASPPVSEAELKGAEDRAAAVRSSSSAAASATTWARR